MSYFLLGVSVVMMVGIWPMNRWVLKHEGRTRSIGLAITLTGTVLAAGGAFITGQPLYTGIAVLLGSVTGVAYSFGFCMIIFYCLKIGPSGPTVTLNNLGFLFPVLLSIFVISNGKTPTVFSVLGIVLIVFSLVLMAFNKTDGDTSGHSSKWFKWVIAGWFLSGISMAAQSLATYYEEGRPFTFAFCANLSAFLILLVMSLFKRDKLPGKTEIIGGVTTGFVNILSTVILFFIVKEIPIYIIYPVLMATPILVMLVVGHYIYREKMNRFGWAACVMGIAGLVAFNL